MAGVRVLPGSPPPLQPSTARCTHLCPSFVTAKLLLEPLKTQTNASDMLRFLLSGEEGLKRNETPRTFTTLVQGKKDQELPPGFLF